MAVGNPKEGWGQIMNARKAHYFRDGVSLCGKWMAYPGRLDDNDGHPDNCAACRRLRAKEKSHA